MGKVMLGSRIVGSILVKILGRRIFLTMLVRMFRDPGNNLGKDLGWGNLGYNLGKNLGLVNNGNSLEKNLRCENIDYNLGENLGYGNLC